MLDLAGVAFLTLAVLVVLKPLVYLFALLKTQFRRPTIEVADAVELPKDLRAYLEQGAQPLLIAVEKFR